MIRLPASPTMKTAGRRASMRRSVEITRRRPFMCVPAVEPIAGWAMGIGGRMIIVAAPKACVRINPRVSIVAGMADVTGAAMEAMEPWTRANENPA